MESIIATREEIQHFLSIPTFVNPWFPGYSDCSDSGFGCGDGFGYGTSNGLGYGDNFSSGSKFDFGDGTGLGSGAGSSDGFGSCYSDNDIKALNGNIIDYIDTVPTIITQVHNNFARGYTVKDDLTLQSCYIVRIGNSFAHGKVLKYAVADAEEKELQKMPIKERIAKFIKVFGSLDSEHTGKEFYDWHHILTGSCRMGRDEFCKLHNIDLTHKYSVGYFLDITKNSYGSDMIQQVYESYKLINE